MKRACLSLIAALALIAFVNSCCLQCCKNVCTGPSCPNSATQPLQPDRAHDVYALVPGKVPSPFLVATSSDGRCQDVAGEHGQWVGRVLFTLPGATYCAYAWESSAVAFSAPSAFAGAPNLSQAENDPPAISMQQTATSAEDNAWLAPLYARTRERLGFPASADRPVQKNLVRVAVVDSASGDYYGQWADSSGHGRAVARLIDDTACAGRGDCKVKIANYPALPLDTNASMMLRTSAAGMGVFGTRAQLAEQIEKASSEWVRDRIKDGEPKHLVINLSLGWSGCWEPSKDRTSFASAIVRLALDRAVCRGAVIVAAGGNRDAIPGCPPEAERPDLKNGEHVYPAMFANTSKPLDAATCKRVGVDVDVKTDAAGNLPLAPEVLGISAVDELDRKLPMADQESTLVAYGNAVVVPDGQGWTVQLSGTSMSAAGVSGIAAALWSAYPERTPAEIVRAMIEPALQLRQRSSADERFICNRVLGGLTPNECELVRRASLCRSFFYSAGADAAKIDEKCGPAANKPSTIELGNYDTGKVPTNAVDCSACTPGSPECETCKAPDPSVVDSAEQPWAVGPQPGGDACGTCVLNRSVRRFDANFRSSWWPTMKNVRLILGTNMYVLSSGYMSDSTVSVFVSAASASQSVGLLLYSRQEKTPPNAQRIDYVEALNFDPSGVAQ
jgi:subtilisin family serine protease